ncbi:hypothetical protein ACFE04_030762 [Oxalis oulophora]
MALIDKIIESPSLVWVMEIKRSRDVTAHSISAVYNTMSTTTGSSSSTIVESRNWLDLPDDVMAKILVKLGAVEIMETVQFVCVSWWRICKNSSMWRRIRITNPDLPCTRYPYFRKMCCEVVNRSDGQLIDISIEHFCDDELLQYIIERSSGLKRLRLLACFGIEEFPKAAAKLPMLEELVIKFYRLSTKELEEIGKSCCRLKSLKLDIEAPILNTNYPCDEQALVIAENMPGLRHLACWKSAY